MEHILVLRDDKRSFQYVAARHTAITGRDKGTILGNVCKQNIYLDLDLQSLDCTGHNLAKLLQVYARHVHTPGDSFVSVATGQKWPTHKHQRLIWHDITT